ncbi:DNA/RNA nuclease SfsA [Treponema primitia]|uniref:DNA/RNA nuclease SfsA n=1 Tax=Treponema primitia TaxID=88058 RepID=UPI00025551FD|nr:DNA/RNA nuclease SfsA [Treponema primitia]
MAEELSLFTNDTEALFVRRPNRFLIIAAPVGKKKELACHCPNPGRLIEFVFPGTRLILEKRDQGNLKAKTGWTAAGLYYRDTVAPLFSSRANKAAEKLILKEIIPGLTEISPEYTLGDSRFDFLCTDAKKRKHLVEVKACSLIEYEVAMFPDAPSGRALKHLEELAELSAQGYLCHVLFVITHSEPTVFIPNLHTDPEFAAALSRFGHAAVPPGGRARGTSLQNTRKKAAAGSGPVAIHAALLRCDSSGRAILTVPALPVDLSHGKLAESNSGNYMILLELPASQDIEVGALGTIRFKAGWYVYAGSARKNLSQRINRHLRRQRKQKHWHLDYLTAWAGKMKALPILSYRNLECDLARDLEKLGGKPIADFGSSDCGCGSHLFYFKAPPMGNREFVDMLLRYRHAEALKET